MWSALLSTIVFAPFVSAVAVAGLIEDRPRVDPGHDDAAEQRRERRGGSASERVFDAADLDGLQIDLWAGDVRLGAADATRVRVELQELDVDEHCHIDVRTDGRRLIVEARPRRARLGGHCEVELTVALPAGLTVTADVGAGDVRLDDLRADLDLELGAGDVRGSVRGAAVSVQAGAGDIQLRELTDAIAAHTGAGDVTLSFDVAPTGVIEARSGLGDVRIALPSQTEVDAHVSTGLGTVRQQLVQRAAASTAIQASTGLGDVVLSEE